MTTWDTRTESVLFNEYSYTLLINQSKVIDDATKFFNSTKDSLNQSVVLYNKAMQVKDEITSHFHKRRLYHQQYHQ